MAKKKRKKNRTRRILVVLVGTIVLLAIVAAVFGQLNDPDRRAESVEFAEVQIRTITRTVTASGRVQPEIEVVISPDVSGEIVELPVAEGQQVNRGDLLARIRPDYYEAQVEQARANLSQSHAMEAQRRADLLLQGQMLERQRQLFEAKVIAQNEYEQAKTNHEIAEAAYEAAEHSVHSAEARLREVQEQLSKTVLYAPMSGTVSQLNIEFGERVTGNELSAGTEIMKIARLDQMELEVEVSENDVVNVALGDTASIEVDAYPDRTFRGVVTEIANSARLQGSSFQEQVTNFPVKIRIMDAHNAEARVAAGRAEPIGETPSMVDYPSFRPGMSGTVDIFSTTVHDVTSVPIQSVTVRDFRIIRRDRARRARAAGDDSTAVQRSGNGDNGSDEEDLKRMVFVVSETMNVAATEVETGISDDRFIEIKSGLEAGQRVVDGPYSAVSRTLDDGQLVKERRRSGDSDS